MSDVNQAAMPNRVLYLVVKGDGKPQEVVLVAGNQITIPARTTLKFYFTKGRNAGRISPKEWKNETNAPFTVTVPDNCIVTPEMVVINGRLQLPSEEAGTFARLW